MLMYAGPDQIIPVASALSTIFGVIMIFWGRLMNVYRRIMGLSSAKTGGSEEKPQA